MYPHVESVLHKAQQGDQASLGELLHIYRGYLLGLAVANFDGRLRARCHPSDVVQETLLEACRDFHAFRGVNEPEFLAWLRRILSNNLARAIETHLLTGKRDLRRECNLDVRPDALGSRIAQFEHWFTDKEASPSGRYHQQEQLAMVLDRIGQLPTHYRDVLILRHIEELPFEEVGARLGKSAGAVRMIWLRALESLREYVSK